MDGAKRHAVIERLDQVPSLRIGAFPTPVEEMARLRAAIGGECPRLFIKRDDYTGFGFGGNKVRKLNYIFAGLQSAGVETVITTGGDRSNHARMTAFFCARLGIKCILVLDRKPRPRGAAGFTAAANFLERELGAELHIARSIEERASLAAEMTAALRNRNVNATEIPLGGALAEGGIGFVAAMRELEHQQIDLDLRFDKIVVASSTGGTHAGMLAGAQIFGLENTDIIGFAPEPDGGAVKDEVGRLLREIGDQLGFSTEALTDTIDVRDDHAGGGYCVDTPEATEAIELVARTEGIILDPVYTGKAMTGMLDLIRNGNCRSDENVLFWHTGGQMSHFYSLD